MSSRAIRKLQKLRDQELQQAPSHEDGGTSEDEPVTRPSKPKLNAFDILNAADEAEHDSDDDVQQTMTQAPEPVPEPVSAPAELVDSNKTKKKKKDKKKKAPKSVIADETSAAKSEAAQLDAVDRALDELKVDHKQRLQDGGPSAFTGNMRDPSFPKLPEELLSIEPKSLNATNEMRRLFGNVVFENFDQSEGTGPGRRRNRQPETIDLGRALTGPYSPASRGQSLGGVTLRRNVLMQGKDEWPRAPSGGLGMETADNLPTGVTVYRLVHNTVYQDVQRQFDMCVESMDPQRLIHLLQYNPYHISTLLQVSEIAKHQGDHAVASDLLERALFNIGRSASSSFGNQLKEGRARLDFMHMENRELWLVGWRYISNLGMKGTWRTAYEWAKLLLSLNANDPYCIRLLIDHLALRGREYAHFVELCTQTRLSKEWEQFPNIHCSLALALLRLNKPKECREQLRLAMSRYPWVFCRLAQELDIKPMPKQIWGKMPPTDSHELFTELYIARTKDLWNTPETVALVVEVADTLPDKEQPVEPPEITLDVARHVIVSDIARVTGFLPQRFVSGRISSSDPLPPYESEAFRQQSNPVPSYLSQIPELGRPQWLRDLLDQLNNGAIHFPRFRGEGTDEDGDSSSDEAAGRLRPTDNPHPPANQQSLLQEWLLGDGLHELNTFLCTYGVDRGNWDDVDDFSPLTEYVEALTTVHPPSAQDELLNGPIRERLGDMAIGLLVDEIEILRDEEAMELEGVDM